MDWAKKLEDLSRPIGKTPTGDGWFTAHDFMAETQTGYTRAYRLIKEGLQAGTLEIHKGSEWNEHQRQLTKKVWYKFIDPK